MQVWPTVAQAGGIYLMGHGPVLFSVNHRAWIESNRFDVEADVRYALYQPRPKCKVL